MKKKMKKMGIKKWHLIIWIEQSISVQTNKQNKGKKQQQQQTKT